PPRPPGDAASGSWRWPTRTRRRGWRRRRRAGPARARGRTSGPGPGLELEELVSEQRRALVVEGCRGALHLLLQDLHPSFPVRLLGIRRAPLRQDLWALTRVRDPGAELDLLDALPDRLGGDAVLPVPGDLDFAPPVRF